MIFRSSDGNRVAIESTQKCVAAVVSGGIDVVQRSALVDRACDVINKSSIYIVTNVAVVGG